MNPKRIKRYRDIGRLLVKYGRKDLVNRSWFDHKILVEVVKSQLPSR